MDKNAESRADTPQPTEQKYTETPLLALSLGGGLASMCLRLYMNAHCFGVDGLLHRGCVLHTLLVVLSVLVTGALAWFCRGMGSDNRFRRNYAPSTPGALCCFGAAVCFLLFGGLSLVFGSDLDRFHQVVSFLSLLAASCLVFMGLARRDGKRSAFLFPLGACLFLALRLICEFRSWSSDPVIEDYCYSLLANAAAMLAAYHMAGFSLERGSRRRSLFFGLLALYFSLLSLPDQGSGSAALFFPCGVALWMLGTMPRMRKPQRRRRPGGQIIPTDSEGSLS